MKTLLLFPLILFSALHASTNTNTGTDTTVPIHSPNDTRRYQAFTLPNRMKVLLISDPSTPIAAASLSVNVGSVSDPARRQGLAHFLEHMLFMGTGKYPEPGGYQKFIGSHGGMTNAGTSLNVTNYSFTVKADALDEALDRFAQFFAAPRFDPRYVRREKHAVDSEYRMKLKSEARRFRAVMLQAYNPESPYSRFTVGSLQTLADQPGHKVRDDLIRFWKKHYSSNIMGLVVLGPQPLAELKKMVASRFGAVPDRNATVYTPGEKELALHASKPAAEAMKPLSDTRNLMLIFPIPSPMADYRVDPMDYIGALLGSAAPDSFYDLARQKGWVNGLTVSGDTLDPKQGQVQVSMDLSAEGVKHMEDLLGLFYAYADLIRKKGVEKWRYEEQKRLADLAMRYTIRENPYDYVTSLADRLHYYPAKEVIVGGRIFQRYDPKVIEHYLSYLRPDNALSILMDPSAPTDRVEKWYGVPCSYRRLNAKDATPAPSPLAAKLRLPEPNPFVPKQLTLKSFGKNTPKVPEKLVDEPGFHLWHLSDGSFAVPRASLSVLLRSPVASETPADAAAFALWILATRDRLQSVREQAARAGLGFTLKSAREGMLIQLFGYDEKLPMLFDTLLKALNEPGDPRRLQQLKKVLRQTLEEEYNALPFQQVFNAVLRNLVTKTRPPKEMIAALPALDAKALRDYRKKFFRELEAEILTLGNLTPEESRKLAGTLRKKLLSQTRMRDLPPPAVNLPEAGRPRILTVPVRHQDAVVVRTEISPTTDAGAWARWQLTAHLFKQPFYSELRARQQLGYAVMADSFSVQQNPGLFMIVESSNTPVPEIEKRMEAFVKAFDDYLPTMPPKEFDAAKSGLITLLTKPDTSLAERTDRLFANLVNGHYGFDFNEKISEEVKKLDPGILASYFHKRVMEKPVRVYGVSAGTFGAPKAPGQRK